MSIHPAPDAPSLFDVRQILQSCLQYAHDGELLELRYHHKELRSLTARDGALERALVRTRSGVGVRVHAAGTWGFACTSDASSASVARCIAAARANALGSASLRSDQRPRPPAVALAVGDYAAEDADEEHPLDERIALVLRLQAEARAAHPHICSAAATYTELRSAKAIVTSDGARCTVRLTRPELSIQAVAEALGQRNEQNESLGATGGWRSLFRRNPSAMAEQAARRAVELLDAGVPEGGKAKVILSPDLVGLLVHEAIGHTVEADFVQSGTVATGRLGEQVASPLVTLRDSGDSVHAPGAGGTEPVDDEGVASTTATVIEAGVLVGYLHNRESAARFGVAPTGNARAWEFSDAPLIRMRNTYIEPGADALDAIIDSTADGWLLEGARNGQADATGEFTFGSAQARRIQQGVLGPPMRGVTVTGLAFDVLKTVDAVSSAFAWDLGSGHCGKGQPAKVDAGGPYVRCEVTLAGAQG